MKKKTKRRNKIVIIVVLFSLIVLGSVGLFLKLRYDELNKTTTYYLANDLKELTIYGEEGKSITLPRGKEVAIKNKTIEIDGLEYRIFENNGIEYWYN